MNAQRIMKLRDAIILGMTFLLITLGNKHDVNVPDWAGEFFGASDGTMRNAIIVTVLFSLRVASRKSPSVDKVLHLGNVFPAREIEHTGAEKLLHLHDALEIEEVIIEIQEQVPSVKWRATEDSAWLGEAEDEGYVDWATDVLRSLGEK